MKSMTPKKSSLTATGPGEISRRRFVARAGAAAASLTILSPHLVRGAEANSKIAIGLVGCGGRGKWISELFQNHGGYKVVAVADYFPERAAEAGQKLGVAESGRFSGLHGYQRVLEQKVDAVVIESPPYFHPIQAAAAVDAGKHVYLAKPIAVDVPGCRTVADSGKKATEKKRCFLVDFQTRAHPAYQEVVRRVRAGGIGRLVTLEAVYHCSLMFGPMDAEYRKHVGEPEARLRAWAIDRVLSGDVITEQHIHALDVATWFVGVDPVRAQGMGGRARDFAGDCWDHFAVVYEFPGGELMSFTSKQVGFGLDDILCRAHGTDGTVETHYGGKVWLRSRDDAFNGDTPNLYADGAVRNIAAFHDNIIKGDFSNPTVAPSVRSTLTTILGRAAAYRKGAVTWDEMMKANERWEFDAKGLKT